jgi:hypothetical protein
MKSSEPAHPQNWCAAPVPAWHRCCRARRARNASGCARRCGLRRPDHAQKPRSDDRYRHFRRRLPRERQPFERGARQADHGDRKPALRFTEGPRWRRRWTVLAVLARRAGGARDSSRYRDRRRRGGGCPPRKTGCKYQGAHQKSRCDGSSVGSSVLRRAGVSPRLSEQSQRVPMKPRD